MHNLYIGDLQPKKGPSDPKWAYFWPNARDTQHLSWCPILCGRQPLQGKKSPLIFYTTEDGFCWQSQGDGSGGSHEQFALNLLFRICIFSGWINIVQVKE